MNARGREVASRHPASPGLCVSDAFSERQHQSFRLAVTPRPSVTLTAFIMNGAGAKIELPRTRSNIHGNKTVGGCRNMIRSGGNMKDKYQVETRLATMFGIAK